MSEGAAVTLNGIDLAAIPDGSYTGSYDFKRWSNSVTVHVKNQQIVDTLNNCVFYLFVLAIRK